MWVVMEMIQPIHHQRFNWPIKTTCSCCKIHKSCQLTLHKCFCTCNFPLHCRHCCICLSEFLTKEPICVLSFFLRVSLPAWHSQFLEVALVQASKSLLIIPHKFTITHYIHDKIRGSKSGWESSRLTIKVLEPYYTRSNPSCCKSRRPRVALI